MAAIWLISFLSVCWPAVQCLSVLARSACCVQHGSYLADLFLVRLLAGRSMSLRNQKQEEASSKTDVETLSSHVTNRVQLTPPRTINSLTSGKKYDIFDKIIFKKQKEVKKAPSPLSPASAMHLAFRPRPRPSTSNPNPTPPTRAQPQTYPRPSPYRISRTVEASIPSLILRDFLLRAKKGFS